jgi:LysM repeat protein
MSTMTLTAPLIRPRRATAAPVRVQRAFVGSAPVRPRPKPPAGRTRTDHPTAGGAVRARPAAGGRPATAPVAVSRSSAHALRLTARGRAVLLGLLLALATAVTLATGTVSMAGSVSTPVPVSYVTVEAGDTLWSIAGEVAPGADRRDTVAQMVELNALPGSVVRAGQQIAVPLGG